MIIIYKLDFFTRPKTRVGMNEIFRKRRYVSKDSDWESRRRSDITMRSAAGRKWWHGGWEKEGMRGGGSDERPVVDARVVHEEER